MKRTRLVIDSTWDGEVIGPDERVSLALELGDAALVLDVDAPFHGDPAPPGVPGSCDGLWEFEVAELFLLGAEQHYLEIELGPFGHYLALSLHGATDEVREQIMPINRKYPLKKLLPTVRYFSQMHGRMLTLEYILIANVNDSLTQARALAKIAHDLHAHVNLIPYNKVEGLEWKRPDLARQSKFAEILREAGVSHTSRKEKGHDIDAACGQLRLRKEQELKATA